MKLKVFGLNATGKWKGRDFGVLARAQAHTAYHRDICGVIILRRNQRMKSTCAESCPVSGERHLTRLVGLMSAIPLTAQSEVLQTNN